MDRLPSSTNRISDKGEFRLLSEPMRQALLYLAGVWKDPSLTWLAGGSCGLLLQGVPLPAPPRDLDLYADKDQAGKLADLLRDHAADRPEWSRTDLYESWLSHYALFGVSVELVGDFQVKSQGSHYRVEIGLLSPYAAAPPEAEGLEGIRLTPLAHELVFNVLRSRPDRYEAIAMVMRNDPERHFPALEAIVRRNRFAASAVRQLEQLAGRRL